jgi:hypothetical protein
MHYSDARLTEQRRPGPRPCTTAEDWRLIDRRLAAAWSPRPARTARRAGLTRPHCARVNYSEHIVIWNQYRLLSKCIGCCADIEESAMRILAAFTILTMSIALADGQARAQTYGPIYGPWAYESAPSSYCLQGRIWGYPGNCQFSSYAQCMATASGTDAYCGINPQYAFALQRRGDYRPRY